MAITNLNDQLPTTSAEELLHQFTDATDASKWAVNGIVVGRSDAHLDPKAYIKRAEVAAIVERMLQKLNLI